MKHYLIYYLLLSCLLSCLSACGQTGPLYLPEKPTQKEVKNAPQP